MIIVCSVQKGSGSKLVVLNCFVDVSYKFLVGVFEKLRKATVSVVYVHLSVRQSVRNNSTATERISMEFYMRSFFESLERKVIFLLECDLNNGYCA